MVDEEKDDLTPFSFFDRLKLPLGLAIAGITLISAGIYFTLQKNDKKDIKFSNTETQNNFASASAEITVHIGGAVVSPGVYSLPINSRVNDLVRLAGGFTDKADAEFIDKNLNLALPLKDGVKIYIPSIGQNANSDNTGEVAGLSSNTVMAGININNTSLSELDSLSGIGGVRAQKIIDNRPYTSIEQLVEKKIIPQSVFEGIKEKITVY